VRPGKGSKPTGDLGVGVKMSPDDQPISGSFGFSAEGLDAYPPQRNTRGI